MRFPSSLASLALPLFAVALALPSFAQDGLTLARAIELALERNPSILIQRNQIRTAEGSVQQARAPFDSVLSAGAGAQIDRRPLRADERIRYPLAGSEQNAHSDNLRFGVDKLLEGGPQVGASYTYSGLRDSVLAAQKIPVQVSDKVAFTLRLPLQYSAARNARANLSAAEAEAEAVQLDTEQTIAATVLGVVRAYWDWQARRESLAVARASEARVVRLAEETAKLVELDEVAPAEINLIGASRLERAAATRAAELQELAARNAVGSLFGMNAEQARQLPPPLESLPLKPMPLPNLNDLLGRALQLRSDLEALRLRERASQERLDVARSSARPQLDLVLSGGYTGLREGGPLLGNAPFGTPAAGANIGATLVYQFPVQNSAAEGAISVAYANLDSARLRQRTLADAITVAVSQAHATLATTVSQLELSFGAVERYRQSVKNEETKRALGSATLIDVLNVEDRLNNALLARIQYQQAYVSALAQLDFESGRLVRRDDAGGHSVALETLLPK